MSFCIILFSTANFSRESECILIQITASSTIITDCGLVMFVPVLEYVILYQ